MPKSLIGVTFHSSYADGNPLWKVVRKVGPSAWEAVCEDEDWGGTVKLFSTKEIKGIKSYEKTWKENGNEYDDYYASLKVGQTVHYCNGFKEFVECVVVQKDGKNVLQPVALKGEWQKWDLPHRQPDGLISLGYHAKQIVNKETFTPNYTSIVECPQSGYRKVSPETLTRMPRLDLEVPPMDARQSEIAKILSILIVTETTVENLRKELYADNGTIDLVEVRKKVAEALKSQADMICS